MAASIQFLTGSLVGTTYTLNKAVITIGRASDSDIYLAEMAVSRQHAHILYDGTRWDIEKVALDNVLIVNERYVQREVLHDRDIVKVSTQVSFIFMVQQAEPDTLPTPIPEEPIAPPKFSLDENAPPPTFLVEIVLDNISAKQSYPLTKPTMSIGRDQSNDIVIPNTFISSFHIEITQVQGAFFLEHPHSKARNRQTMNGLRYEGRAIQGYEQFRKQLVHGDVFRFGKEPDAYPTLTVIEIGKPLPTLHRRMAIALDAPVISIGSAPDNTLLLDSALVAPYHAQIRQISMTRQGARHELVNLSTKDATTVNHHPVEATCLLSYNDEITFGSFKFIYTFTHLASPDETDLDTH